MTPWTRKSNGTFAPASTTTIRFLGWPGSNLFARAEHAHAALAEAPAHVFHNCKRRTIGLPSTPRREWILDIDFAKGEMFAYACKAYSRILELGDGPAARRALLLELEREPPPSADRVDGGEYVDVLREAVTRRNGWKRILARCAPPRRTRHPDPRTA